jgi:superfamily II RNA helicase
MVKICDAPYPSNSKYESHFELYPYPLSDFQKYAIEAIVEGHHVLVTAHTGSGKTLPAEFAINHFVGQGKKVIYTSPIKALSNQKYYEFTQKYPHISFGLFTGDIKTNPDADVLIMTTEILMNYLFNLSDMDKSNGSGLHAGPTHAHLQFQIDIRRDLACVVFDEVHYINDLHRGQTWEQTILMLPLHIQMVMLSATIDAPERFADWVQNRDGTSASNGSSNGSSNGASTSTNDELSVEKQVYLASTNKRAVPLTHYAYLTVPESIFKGVKDKTLESEIRGSTNTLIMLQSDKGVFQDNGYSRLAKMTKIIDQKQVFTKRKMVLNNLALFLRERDMLPAIAFVFSRKNVELCAQEITIPLLEDDSKVSYTVKYECEQIVRKLPNYQEYLGLPEYNQLVALLEKGIGIHHSGMIPVLREIVELMISKRYIKLLFATESFAIGLDCPIKTAIFTGLTKFDGSTERNLMSHEYTQMAGRAGRRGIDTIGHVVHCNNLFPMTMTEYKNILCGSPQKLVSKFHVTYSMILNLLKSKEPDDTTAIFTSAKRFTDFAEKSMVHGEIKTSMEQTKNRMKTLEQTIETKKNGVEIMRTPQDICRRFLELESKKQHSVNKKRKDIERELGQIQDEYKYLKTDLQTVIDFDALQKEYAVELSNLEYLSTYLNEQINSVCSVLTDYDFIFGHGQIDEQGSVVTEYELTNRGKMASNMAEVHPVVMSIMMDKWTHFEKFTPKQLICLFSCFTDIKVANDVRCSVPTTDDAFIKARVKELADTYKMLEGIEFEKDMKTGMNYDEALVYDIIDEVAEWCNCSTEEECKYFIQTKIAEKSISIGDFTKAILKISVIAKELMNVCEQFGLIDLLHKLSQIDPMILKYITISQSLYV